MTEVHPQLVLAPIIELIPARTLRYSDWDQFVLIDADGFAVSTTTGRRCDPLNSDNQQSMVDVLHAMGPWHKLGFVLSEADPFFQMVSAFPEEDLPGEEKARSYFPECTVSVSRTGSTLVSGASFNVPDDSEICAMLMLDVCTQDRVLNLPIDSAALTHPFIPTLFDRWVS